MIKFIIGTAVGGIIGVVFTALCNAASKADAELEEFHKNIKTDINCD